MYLYCTLNRSCRIHEKGKNTKSFSTLEWNMITICYYSALLSRSYRRSSMISVRSFAKQQSVPSVA